MSDYLSINKKEREEMLKALGIKDINELFEDIPLSLLSKGLSLPSGKSQQEVLDELSSLADKNKVFKVIMRGAGSYNHYIPSAVKNLASRSEFVTAYTPYQAEMSQGILQAIFEYQTMICELTGMDVSNASVYNGSTAAAEAALMCLDRNRNVILVPDNIKPDTLEVLKTYLNRKNMIIKILPVKDGLLDHNSLKAEINEKTACVYIEQPNYFGLIEDAEEIGKITKSCGAKYIMGCNPMTLAILKSPKDCGADIAVGEAQPFGLPMSFGGPYLGYMAATNKEMRKLPGRIVGETVDSKGNRAYVLTLQAREQHIRRDKASSNICSNEAHCALTAAVYLACMGPKGLYDVAEACLSLGHYMADKMTEAGAELKYNQEFFHEFVTVSEVKADKILAALESEGILGGLKLSENEIMWCATEMLTKEDIDRAAEIIRGLK